jgi:hypothetical protein
LFLRDHIEKIALILFGILAFEEPAGAVGLAIVTRGNPVGT